MRGVAWWGRLMGRVWHGGECGMAGGEGGVAWWGCGMVGAEGARRRQDVYMNVQFGPCRFLKI